MHTHTHTHIHSCKYIRTWIHKHVHTFYVHCMIRLLEKWAHMQSISVRELFLLLLTRNIVYPTSPSVIQSKLALNSRKRTTKVSNSFVKLTRRNFPTSSKISLNTKTFLSPSNHPCLVILAISCRTKNKPTCTCATRATTSSENYHFSTE